MDPVQLVSTAALVLTVLIVAIASLLDLADRLGLPLPRAIGKHLSFHDEHIITVTLEKLGVLSSTQYISQAVEYARLKNLIPDIDPIGELEHIICAATRRETASVGLYDRIPLEYYTDLGEMTSAPDEAIHIASLICSNIRKQLDSLSSGVRIDKIAAPPGNPALAVYTSFQLKKPFVFVQPISPNPADPITGGVKQGEYVILIHDVVLTGKRMADVAGSLRAAGAIVQHAFVLVERTDARRTIGETPSETLSKNGIALHAMITIDDGGLVELLKRRGQSI